MKLSAFRKVSSAFRACSIKRTEVSSSTVAIYPCASEEMSIKRNRVLLVLTYALSWAQANSIGFSTQCLIGNRTIWTSYSIAATFVLYCFGGTWWRAISSNSAFVNLGSNFTLCSMSHCWIWSFLDDHFGGLLSSVSSLCHVALSIMIPMRGVGPWWRGRWEAAKPIHSPSHPHPSSQWKSPHTIDE